MLPGQRQDAERTRGASAARLAARELHRLWESLDEEHRISFLGSLSDEAADQLLAYQLRKKEQAERSRPRPNRTVETKHWPDGDPDMRWSDEQLAAYLAHHEAELAAAPVPKSEPRGEAI